MAMAEVTLLPGGGAVHEHEKKEKDGSIWQELGDESRLARNLPMYRKVRAIGRGAFGKAYLVETMRGANHKGGGRQRVLKRLPLTSTAEDHREAAFREALLMRRISVNCPFITQFHEVFRAKAGTALCIVMEYCSGGDLRNFLLQRKDDGFKRLSEAEVLALAAQVSLALQHVHGNGVLHRDVKPENCFFRSQGGDLLLGDFGISCSMDERSFAKTCIGSPLYLSPEIVNQERYSYSTDVWSLGVMLYEMAALEAPFKGANICQIAFKIVGSTPDPLDEGAFSTPLRQLIERMLDKSPGTRISMRDALLAEPLQSAAAAASAEHGLLWPPQLGTTGVGRRGLVQKLRGHVTCADGPVPTAVTAPPGCPMPPAHLTAIAEDCGVVYDDDFEAYDELDDELGDEPDDEDAEAWPGSPASPVYQDDFEDDFEEPSGSEGSSYGEDFEDASDDESPAADTEDLVSRWREELGEDSLASGVVSFARRLHDQEPRASMALAF